MQNKLSSQLKLAAIIPAAGIGRRMEASIPKQYLKIGSFTILELTLNRLLKCSYIKKIVIVLHPDDIWFSQLSMCNHPKINTVIGGRERAESVFNGLNSLNSTEFDWVMVHDAARPCVLNQDIERLIEHCLKNDCGGILAYPVRDTMKRSDSLAMVTKTESREQLWHALTPQMFRLEELRAAMSFTQKNNHQVTDEASAIESYGKSCQLIQSSALNIKVTQPEDMALASIILNSQESELCG